MLLRRWIGFAGLATLAGLLLMTTPSPRAEASSLDKALLMNAGDVVEYLKKNKIKTVGVLPFQVKRGSRAASLTASPLSTNMPERIENALIMVMDPDESKAVGIIRNATAAVSKAKVGQYRTSRAAYDKLFKPTYDLSWSGKTARADAFLTGVVTNSGTNRGETIVELQLLKPDSFKSGKLKPVTIKRFKSRTDAMLVADLGYNFALSPKVLKRGPGLKVAKRSNDDLVIDQTTAEDEKGDRRVQDGQSAAHTPANIAGFVFELEYNGVKQAVRRKAGGDGAKQPEYEAPAPKPGDRVAMYMTRVDESDRKLGVLLLVNGKSTFNFEEGEPMALRKWILGPTTTGKRQEWLGFYTDKAEGNLHRFRALTSEDSLVHMDQLGEKAGQIEVMVFGSGEQPEKQGKVEDPDKEKDADTEKKDEGKEKKDADKKDEEKEKKAGDKDEKPPVQDDKDMFVSTRGVVKGRSNRLSLEDLRAQLMKANNVKQKKSLVNRRSAGGLILHDVEPIDGGTFATTDLPYPQVLGHLIIRYYSKPGDSPPITD